MSKCFPNVTKYLTASKISVEDGKRLLCLYLVYFHITDKRRHLIVKSLWVPTRAFHPDFHLALFLERKERKSCHRQSCTQNWGRKAHSVRGIKLTSVKTVWNSLPCVWVVQPGFLICVLNGWLEKYYKKVTMKSQKITQVQVYKALKQGISFQHRRNRKQCNITCFAKSEGKAGICSLI